MIYTEPQPRINLILSELILDIIMMLHSDIDQTIFSFSCSNSNHNCIQFCVDRHKYILIFGTYFMFCSKTYKITL